VKGAKMKTKWFRAGDDSEEKRSQRFYRLRKRIKNLIDAMDGVGGVGSVSVSLSITRLEILRFSQFENRDSYLVEKLHEISTELDLLQESGVPTVQLQRLNESLKEILFHLERGDVFGFKQKTNSNSGGIHQPNDFSSLRMAQASLIPFTKAKRW
jgi:hypothetical protein